MADFARKEGKSRDDRGLGSVVDFLLANARVVLGVSGAAVLAIATLAVKRLIDRATSLPDEDDDIKAKQKSLEESWQELSLIKAVPKVRRQDLEAPLLSSATDGPGKESESSLLSSGAPVTESRPTLCLTLQEKLLAFSKAHVSVSESEKALGKQLAEDVCAAFQTFLKTKSPELPFANGWLSGYLCDDVASRGHLEVSFMLPLVLEPNLWRLVPGEQTVVNNPRFGLVKRTGLEYFQRGSSAWDRFLVGGYLSSNAIHEALHKILMASTHWPVLGSVLECVIRPAMAPKQLKLEVVHRQTHLDIALCPMIEAGDKILLSTSSEEPGENLWEENFYTAEISRLKDLDARDSGARRRCLSLLKVLLGNHPFWTKVSGAPLTHVLLHVSETETDWSEATLADRFQQVLEELVQFLAKGSLPCFFDSRINLLDHLLPEEIEDIGCTLYEALAQPDLAAGFGL
uniref:Mitochondrial dynamics protein MID49 n=1 Tax=Pogona vitticeps TaxID=103695 RepID=A0A6J0VDH3_9SAUR